jgi:threonine/homoserine/homoserine lactone efflux protein
MPVELFIPYAAVGFFVAMFCSSIAREKGHNEIVWLILGFFFSFIALIAIAGMPDLVSRKYLRRLAEALPPAEVNGPKFDTSSTT